MRLRHILVGLTLMGLAGSTACTTELSIDDRAGEVSLPTGTDLPDNLEGCQVQCITCIPGECESECFPVGECDVPEEGCGFIAVCAPGYSWSEDECTCLPDDSEDDDDHGNGKGQGHDHGHGKGNDKDDACEGTVTCVEGTHWDDDVCGCVQDTPAGPPRY